MNPEFIKQIVNMCLDRAAYYQERAAKLYPYWEATGNLAAERRIEDYDRRAAHWADIAWRLAFPGTC